jgi:hypothetical protein
MDILLLLLIGILLSLGVSFATDVTRNILDQVMNYGCSSVLFGAAVYLILSYF